MIEQTTPTSVTDPSIVRKVGQGFDRPKAEQELPIDISHQRVLEWLVGRQKLPKDWHKRVAVIKTNASVSFKQLPATITSKLSGGGTDTSVDYYRAVEIRDALLPGAEKTIFGGLTGLALTWDKIVKAYEKDSIFIGEVTQALSQHADYDIPFLKKQSAKHNQQLMDLERKQAELDKSVLVCADNYQQECKKIGITGVFVRQELLSLTTQLPQLFTGAVSPLHSSAFASACRYYADFTEYAHSRRGTGASQSASSATHTPPPPPHANSKSHSDCSIGSNPVLSAASMLPILTEVCEGRTAPAAASFSAFISRAAPETHTASPNHAGLPQSVADPDQTIEIDFGCGISGGEDSALAEGLDGTSGGDIDWGCEITSDGPGGAAGLEGMNDGANISWDITGLGEASGGADVGGGGDERGGISAADRESGGALEVEWDITGVEDTTAGSSVPLGSSAIDWQIDMTEAGNKQPEEGQDQGLATEVAARVIQPGSSCGGSSRGCSSPDEVAALRLIQDAEYRVTLVDELQELHGFLSQRQQELSSRSNDMLSLMMPEAIRCVDAGSVEAWKAEVAAVVAHMSAGALRELLLIATSPSYLDRLTTNLQRKGGQRTRLATAQQEVLTRRAEATAELRALQPRMSTLVKHCQLLKAGLEKAISGLHAGRAVNVMGDFNAGAVALPVFS